MTDGTNRPSPETRLHHGGSTGFTLVEVLVALVVLAIGLLGLAGLQAAGQKYNHSAYQYSQATQSAYDILDRMRANRDVAESTNDYKTGFTDVPSSSPSPDCGLAASTCSGGEIAAYDIYQWKTQLAQTLPNATAEVDYSTATGQRIYVITIRWDNLTWNAAKKALTHTSSISFQLRSQI